MQLAFRASGRTCPMSRSGTMAMAASWSSVRRTMPLTRQVTSGRSRRNSSPTETPSSSAVAVSSATSPPPRRRAVEDVDGPGDQRIGDVEVRHQHVSVGVGTVDRLQRGLHAVGDDRSGVEGQLGDDGVQPAGTDRVELHRQVAGAVPAGERVGPRLVERRAHRRRDRHADHGDGDERHDERGAAGASTHLPAGHAAGHAPARREASSGRGDRRCRRRWTLDDECHRPAPTRLDGSLARLTVPTRLSSTMRPSRDEHDAIGVRRGTGVRG